MYAVFFVVVVVVCVCVCTCMHTCVCGYVGVCVCACTLAHTCACVITMGVIKFHGSILEDSVVLG